MNAVAFITNQSSSLQVETPSTGNPAAKTKSAFDVILEKQASDHDASAQGVQQTITLEMIKEHLRVLQEDSGGLKGLSHENLAQLLLDDLGLESLDEDLLAQIQLFAENVLFNDPINLSMDTEETHLIDPFTSYALPLNLFAAQQSGQTLTDAQVMEQLTHLFNEVKTLLGSLSNEQEIAQAAPKILEWLEKWTKLETEYRHVMEDIKGLSESREGKWWKELLFTFQKRNQFTMNQQYHSNATVTSKDVANWLSRALSVQSQAEQSTVQAVEHGSGIPMSKLEQYVVHVQQGQGAQPADKQLMDQFQNVMKTSRFLTMNNGMKQLSITLRPENLGEMMVRLTEINGEMTVKILVSSQATRQMLEANIHQLKNMFAPHQVVIEESNDLNIQSTPEEQEQQDQPLDDHDKQESSQQSNKEKSKDPDISFHDVLMNEKV